jgi:hypothetical protein
MDHVMQSLGAEVSRSALYQFIGANPVAAVPSLHAGLPMISAVFAWRISRPIGIALTLYATTVCLSIVYMGEHYVFDIAAAIPYVLLVLGIALHQPRRQFQTEPEGAGPNAL